uniref:Sema domain-containing protein n=1 Tax=Ciona intestinalis TaxID=7719 RepID=F6VS24_CIOIN
MALLVTILTCLLLGLCLTLPGVAFPKDAEPNMSFDSKVVPHLPVFVGSGPGGTTGELTDVQQVTTIGKKVVISARNSIYVFDPQSFTTKNRRISFEQILRWYPQNDTNCYQRTTLLRNCQNYIRVVTPITPNAVLVCGTNSARPTCREYEID